jgi:MoxR-like ATPase
LCALVAHSAERILGKNEVPGSNPGKGSFNISSILIYFIPSIYIAESSIMNLLTSRKDLMPKAASSSHYRPDVQELITTIQKIMFGKEHVTELILITIICNDHILLEDVPGTGKTLLINTIARILDLQFKRIQGTPDLLPGDLTGVNIFYPNDNQFHFMAGPIFTNILLFDEINRTSPKTQSALLEAMAESQVSVDTATYALEHPFLVIATQNPVEHLGTYPLPQAQLDRFLIKTRIGYPNREDQRKIMLQEEAEIQDMELPRLSKKVLNTWQKEYKQVFIKDDVIDKLLDLFENTRTSGLFSLGISPRSARKLIKALKASAYIHGRDFVNKDDIYGIFLPVMVHRVVSIQRNEEEAILRDLLVKTNF